MAVTSTIIGVIGAAAGAAGTYSQSQAAQRQANAQSQQAARNAQIAEQNAQLAEEEGREAKKIGYENAVKKRQEAAQIIGAQRAAFGASGAQVDQGAALDVALDTAEKGEIDAFQLRQQGLDTDYNKRFEAWNYREQAAGLQAQSAAYKDQASSYNPWLSAGSTLLTGVGQAGQNFYRLYGGADSLSKSGKSLFDSAVAPIYTKSIF